MYTRTLQLLSLLSVAYAQLPKIMCLHGGGQNGASMAGMTGMAQLQAALASEFEFVYVDSPTGVWINDAPGGKSAGTSDPNWAQSSVDLLNGVVASQGPFYAILGYSQGGSMTMIYLAQGAGTFQKALVFCASNDMEVHQGLAAAVDAASPFGNIPAYSFQATNDAFYQNSVAMAAYFANPVMATSDTAGHAPPESSDATFNQAVEFLRAGATPATPATPPPSTPPTLFPTQPPTGFPTQPPSPKPVVPTQSPTLFPTQPPTTSLPTQPPTTSLPTQAPTLFPTEPPTGPVPTQPPTTSVPTQSPTLFPTQPPTTSAPSVSPTGTEVSALAVQSTLNQLVTNSFQVTSGSGTQLTILAATSTATAEGNVLVQATFSGTLSDFDDTARTAAKNGVASNLGISPERVTITAVSGGSVVVDFIINNPGAVLLHPLVFTPAPGSSGLSTGAIVGIVVGCVVAISLAVVLTVYCCCSKDEVTCCVVKVEPSPTAQSDKKKEATEGPYAVETPSATQPDTGV